MKRIALSVFLLTVFCTAPIREYLEPAHGEVKQADTVEIQRDPPVPKFLENQDWIGREFVALRKQEIFCQSGYELYDCEGLNKCAKEPESSYVTPEHRIKCEMLSGHVLKVNDVKRIDDEWLVVFTDNNSGKYIYGKTHKGAVKEIALETDLGAARERWLNRIVFSRRGVISTGANGKSSFGSSKVGIQDSLKVIDVSWGVTPLPVNPIWLTVEDIKTGQKGFIPVRYSWTNTMSDRIRPDADAWSEDILEKDPTATYSWDETMWELINNHRIVVEMTREQVALSWGEPLSREKKVYEGIDRECWVYASQELYFDDKGLIGMVEKSGR